jgi:HlyD family secretion protein
LKSWPQAIYTIPDDDLDHQPCNNDTTNFAASTGACMYKSQPRDIRYGTLPGKYICFMVFGISLCCAACKEQFEKTQPVVENITESVYASGIIKSKHQYQVYATVSGLVQDILVKEGDVVKKGDPILIIRNDISQLQTDNARLSAEFAAENAKGERLNELKTAVEIARTKMQNDSLLWVRQKGLWAQEIGSKVELEQRELAFSNAIAAYQSAIYKYNDLKKQLHFSERQAQKLFSISQNTSREYIVRSQINGRLYSLLKEIGEIINPQNPLATIGDADAFTAELQVDEKDIVSIKKGQRVLLSMDSYRAEVFEAKVSDIDPMMNERTRTFTVRADFVHRPGLLYPFLTTEANILLQQKDQAITIPRAFLIEDSIVILENQEKQKVKTGLKDFQKVEILEGLKPGQTIIKSTK